MADKKEKKVKSENEEAVTSEENIKEEAKKEESAAENVTLKKEEYDSLVAQSEDYKRRLYSVTAEYENYRKRMANTSATRYLDGKADVISKFFAIGDNLDRALNVAPDEKTKQGIEMIIKAYDKIMSEENIESFDPKGEEFDANTSTAITALPGDEGEEPGTVKMTFAKGYKRGDKILRFAQVAVVRED